MQNILKKISEIGQMVDRVKEDESIDSIEIDLILEKIRSLYERVRSLEHITARTTPSPPSTKQSQPVQEKKPESEKKKQEEPIPETPKSGVKKEPEILADRYQNEKKFINETLSQAGRKQNVTSKLQSKPIHSIKSSLGINDRYTLIKELFNGDKQSFDHTIGVLDDAANFNEAFTYINSSFEWDMEDEAVQMLLDLVRRKFIVNQGD